MRTDKKRFQDAYQALWVVMMTLNAIVVYVCAQRYNEAHNEANILIAKIIDLQAAMDMKKGVN